SAAAVAPRPRGPAPWLNDAGPAHAGDAACRREPRHHPGFEPADGIGIFGYGIGKRPRAAARIPLAAGGALGGITGPHGKAGIVPARAIEVDLSVGGRAEH